MQVIGHLVRYSYILYFAIVIQSYAQVYPDDKVDSLWKEINHNIVIQEYSAANQNLNELTSYSTNLPLTPMLSAALEISRSHDLGLEFNYQKIDSLLNHSFLLSEILLEENDKNIWANYFAGASLGYKAYFSAINKDFMNALVDGYSALQYFDKCLHLDNLFHEAKIPIGTYLYWKSEKTSDLNWLPFFNDDKKSGIELLKEACDSSNYNMFFADYSLVWIYIQEREYEYAAKIAMDFLITYPSSRLIKYAAGKAFKEIEPVQTISFYEELLSDYKSLQSNNHLNEIIYLHKLAQLYFQEGNYQKTIEYCEQILNFEDLSKFVYSKISERIERTKKLREEALRIASKN